MDDTIGGFYKNRGLLENNSLPKFDFRLKEDYAVIAAKLSAA